MTARSQRSIQRFLLLLLTSIVIPALGDNPCRILAIGDSISVGYTDNPDWTLPYQFGFRSGLYTRLTNSGMSVQFVGKSAEPWDGKYGVPTNIPTLDLRTLGQDHCEGYGGRKTDFIVANIASWLVINSPDIIPLMAGINDISNGSTAEPVTAEANLSNIVYTIVNDSPNARVIVAQISPYSTYTAAITKYNNYIKNTLVPGFVAQGRHVTTVDQYTNLLVSGITNIDVSLYANGINHPTAGGYERMAQTWFAGIQALSLPVPRPSLRANPLTNGGFEVPAFGNSRHNTSP
jgi:hypothetical protein